ncbi:ADP-heptose--LPS-heptosyltransferase II [Escherichia coli]|uniref:lipopolysaccharide heptosyltransferase II n=1 Tax=Escherichia coli TaxID=562 RepID=A0A376TYL1_ECOLX|nr:ADP-heptose--LPS-heptosyltransferase II [Escherichia coli]
MKILVIGPSWVGDMMMSQSLYRTLQARYPQAIIDVMAPAWCRPLLSRMPEVNEAIPMPLGHGALEIGERRKLGHSLREKRYDRAYVLPNSFKSALVPFSRVFLIAPAGAARCATVYSTSTRAR